ncbi:hypothetical protein HY218_02375 [Candidatus Saccharibacteria bacterium]|nr:hypothetical protein [Candidatus Saccharibacteria bacterium]
MDMDRVDREPVATDLLLPLHGEVLFDEREVRKRINEIAGETIERYRGVNPLFICLLKGAAPFATDLMRNIARQDPFFHPQMDYMMVSTYGDERQPGVPKIVTDLDPKIRETIPGRTVIILDDVLEWGITVRYVSDVMFVREADAVDLIALVQKDMPERTAFGNADIYGFRAPKAWLTGMGMDDVRVAPEGNRWLGYIATGNPIEEEL